MIGRTIEPSLVSALERSPAVALVGPRQVGKTTLALQIARRRPSLYIDLESDADRARISDPELYLREHERELVILDEIHRAPGLFGSLRGLIDRGRRAGLRSGRFLLLGSASIDLLRQSGETLAGRIASVELDPVGAREVDRGGIDELWLRGGFPESLLASDDERSLRWRADFIRTYLERDIPQLGPRIPAETLRRLWTMLAHRQGATLNAAQLAAGLGVDAKTVARYIDLLVDLLLVRRLAPWTGNTGKRLTRSPKLYVRDSGLVHALLRLRDREDLLGHPVAGASWEGFAIENIISAARDAAEAFFYRTAGGAEIDLVLALAGERRWAIEVKRSLAPRLGRGFTSAWNDLRAERGFVVYPGAERYPLREDVEAIGLRELCDELAQRGAR